MSFNAIRWALAQPINMASTKFLLVAMADCVNADDAVMECWPSYAYLARRTSLNTKTVEAGVYRLRQDQYIVDTGKRAGDTGKVVVYRLNDPKTGVVLPGPHITNANGARPHNTPENGVVGSIAGGTGIPPKTETNPPKNGAQSPQKVESMPPKTGSRTSKGSRNGTSKESVTALAVTSIAGVPERLFAEWMAVRSDKRAKTLTQTAVDGLLRESAKAGLTAEQAVRLCVEHNWISLNAGWGGVKAAANSRHTGFDSVDYTEGLNDGHAPA